MRKKNGFREWWLLLLIRYDDESKYFVYTFYEFHFIPSYQSINVYSVSPAIDGTDKNELMHIWYGCGLFFQMAAECMLRRRQKEKTEEERG